MSRVIWMKTLACVAWTILSATSLSAGIINGGFEDPSANAPATGWTNTDSIFGTNRCDLSCSGGNNFARTGDWWIWFGGSSAAQTAVLSQDAVIEANAVNVDFYVRVPVANDFTLQLSMDGNQIWSITEADAASLTTYTLVSLALGAYADGGVHTLRWDYSGNAGGLNNVYLDDVSLTYSQSEVPEPATGLLLLSALGLGAIARRRVRVA